MAYKILTPTTSSPPTITLLASGSPPAGNNITDVYIGFVDKDGNLLTDTGNKTIDFSFTSDASWISDVSFIKKDNNAYQINLKYSPNSTGSSRSTALTLTKGNSTKYYKSCGITHQAASTGGGSGTTEKYVTLSFRKEGTNSYALSSYSCRITGSGIKVDGSSPGSTLYSCSKSYQITGTGSFSVGSFNSQTGYDPVRSSYYVDDSTGNSVILNIDSLSSGTSIVCVLVI